MKRGIICFISLLLLPASLVFGQSAKKIRTNNVVSQTTYEYFLAEGRRDPVVEKIEKYDEEGNLLELKQFNKDGEIKQWEAYKYDENGDVIEEKYFGERGDIVERITYTYKDRLVREKFYYDHKDRLVKKKTYQYEFREEE